MKTRRFKLGDEIASFNQTPSLKFSEDGSQMILTFPVVSTPTPNETAEVPEEFNSERHTHRDLIEIGGGTIFSTGLKVSLSSVGNGATILSLRMMVNSKVPGTGAAHAAVVNNGNNHN